MSRRIVRLALATAVAAMFTVPTAAFAATGDTNVSMNLAGSGVFSITAPATASLTGSGIQPGASYAGSLGSTSVVDSRGTLLGWNVTVLATSDFVDPVGPKTISLAAASSTLTWATGSVSASNGSLLSVGAGAGGNVNKTVP